MKLLLHAIFYLITLGLLPCFAEEKAADATDTPPERVPLNSVITPPVPEEEKELFEKIREEFSLRKSSGRGWHFKNKLLVNISQRKAVVDALEKNLGIRRGFKSNEISEAALLEARAIFNPIFDMAFTYSSSDTFERVVRDDEFKRASTLNSETGDHELVFSQSAQEQSQIKKLVLREARAEQVSESEILANQGQLTPGTDKSNVSISVSQQLPWGPIVSLSTFSAYQETYWFNSPDSVGAYGRPWTTGISASLTIPIPFTKDFGPFSSQDTALQIADINKDTAFWNTKGVINSTLLNTDLAYWNLVLSVMNLESVIENRKNIKKLVEKTGKLYATQRTTRYGKLQVDAELMRIKAAEESAWNNLITASDQMAELLDYDSDRILFPTNYSRLLKEIHPVNSKEVLITGMAQRPEIKVGEQQLRSSWLNYKFSETQTHPDLALTISENISQTGSTFGFTSWGDSLGHLFNPDSKNQTLSLSYNHPYRNQALKSAMVQAHLQFKKQQAAFRSTQNGVVQEINNALTDTYSTRARLELTQNNLDLAQKTYEGAKLLYDANRVLEFEVIRQSNNLLNAHLNLNAARIEYRIAVASLLAAQGIIAQHYADITSPNEFDKYRIGMLNAGKAFNYFGGKPN